MQFSFDTNLNRIAEKVEAGDRLSFEEGLDLYKTDDLNALGTLADFVRRTSIIRYDRGSVKKGEPVVAAFAAMEKLDAHGRSVRIRTV